MSAEIGGWIALHKKILDWEWYDDTNVMRVFLHCLLKANFKAKTWRGNEILRGQFIASRQILAKDLGLTEQQVRTALKKLSSTNEITSQGKSQHTVFTVNKYDLYQSSNQPSNQQVNQQATSEQPASNQRVTTTNKVNKENNITKNTTSSSELVSSDHAEPAKSVDEKVIPIDSVPYQKILDLYHKVLPEFPKVVKLTTGRKSHIKARWKNDLGSLDEWFKYFHIVRRSNFLMGRVPPMPPRTKSFECDLDFLINEAKCVKICEGRYHGE